MANISNDAAIAFNRANALSREGRWPEVIPVCDRVIAHTPHFAPVWVLNARAHAQVGDNTAAVRCYKRALELDWTLFSAHLEIGNLQRRAGETAAAEASYRAAVACKPDDRRGHLALVRVLEEKTPADHAGAAAHYHYALDTEIDDFGAQADTHMRIGKQRLERRDAARALEAFRAAELCARRHKSPTSIEAEVQFQIADALARLGLPEECERALRRLERTDDAQLLRRAATLAYRLNVVQLGVRFLERNATLQPDDGAAWFALADMLSRAWRLSESVAALNQTKGKVNASDAEITMLESTLAQRSGDVEAALDGMWRLHGTGEKGVASRIAMTSLYSSRLAPQEITQLHRDLFADIARDVRPLHRFTNAPNADRPLKVGMVSRDIHRQHPVAIFMVPMLSHWDHARFPLTIYFVGETFDGKTAQARARAGQWRDLPMADVPAAVLQDEIDILIDLAGHTSTTQMELFAKRLAPVQVTYLGYPATTGVPNMDWIVGDPVVTPAEHSHLYSENIVQLPHTVFCYSPEENYPLPDFARAADRPLTFGSFNNTPKLGPMTVELWSNVLAATPKSRLILKAPSFGDAGVVARYRDLFAEQGICADRLEFRGPVGLDEMMVEYGDIDIGLDPVPYNGGTTTLQAMWMGVPVVTMEGGHFVSRMGASFMTAAGLADWVARDAAHYVEIAVAMAADRAALLALKASLRDRLRTRPGWDVARFTRDFEAMLLSLWPPGGLLPAVPNTSA